MNSTSPGIDGQAAATAAAAAVEVASREVADAVASMSIAGSRSHEKELSKTLPGEPISQKTKLTTKDFDWGETLGEGSYSRVHIDVLKSMISLLWIAPSGPFDMQIYIVTLY
jgi:hypothetical protein